MPYLDLYTYVWSSRVWGCYVISNLSAEHDREPIIDSTTKGKSTNCVDKKFTNIGHNLTQRCLYSQMYGTEVHIQIISSIIESLTGSNFFHKIEDS